MTDRPGPGAPGGSVAGWSRTESDLLGIIEGVAVGIIVCSPEGQLLHWNANALALFGYESMDGLRRALVEFEGIYEFRTLDGQVLPTREWPLSRILRGERLQDLTLHIDRRPDGWARVFSFGGQLVKGPGEEPARAVLTVVDVTDRIAAEECARLERQRLQVTLSSIAEAVIATDESGHVTLFNAVAETLTGCTAQSAIGRAVADVVRIVDEDSGEPIECPVTSALRTEHATRPTNHSLLVSRDGSTRPILHSGAPIHDADGRAIGVVLVLRDQSRQRLAEGALRESERRYRLLAENVHDVIWTMDLGSGRFTYVSPSITALRGISVEQAMNERLEDALTPESFVRAQQLLARIGTEDEIALVTEILDQPARDGSIRHTEVTANLVRDASGHPVEILGISRDATARVQAERALRESEARLATIFELAQAGIVVTRVSDGAILDCNDTWLNGLGWSRREVIGHTTRELGLYDDLDARDRLYDEFEKKSSVGPVELRLRRKGGDAGDFVITGAEAVIRGERCAIGVWHDVSELRARDRALRESDARYRAVFDQAAVGVAVAELPGGRFLDVNEQFCQLLGYSRLELLNVSWQDITHPDDLPRDRAAVSAMMSLHESQTREKRYVRKDGSVVWVRLSISPLSPRGEPVTTQVAIVEDVSARRAAEDALESSERWLRTILQTTLDGFAIHDRQGRFIDVNDAFCRMVGYPREQLLRTTLAQIHEIVSPDETRARMDLVEHVGPERFEARYRCADGRVIDIEASVRFLDVDGGRFVGFVRDVTEDKRARETVARSAARFQALIEKSSDMILLVDGARKIAFWSPSATECLGWTADEAVGRDSFEWIHPDDREAGMVEFGRLLQNPGSTQNITNRIRHRDGSWRTLETIARNLLHDPAVGAIVLNARDVTEQRQLAEQFRQAQKLESVGRLAGGVAHDFNNLLTVILSCGEALQEDLAAGDTANPDFVNQIVAAGERARDLTSQLLAFARKQVIAPVALDLNRVVHGSEKLLRRILGEDIELRVELDPELGPVVADPGQVEQVILNLAVNARDAMPHGGRLSIATGSADGGVRLAVADSGIGMTPEVRAHVFEPFFTTKDPGRGTGLGLATVYGIVEQCGGRIELETAPGRGSRFEIWFPRASTPVVTASGTTPDTVPRRGTESVLVVEDDPAVREITARALRNGGYRVLVAASVDDALDIAARDDGSLQLVVTDVVMPGLDGRALVERLRGERPHLRALFVSGYTRDVISHHGVLDEGIAFLSKPFTADSLLQSVRAVLDQPTRG